jgi:hypothetical protein
MSKSGRSIEYTRKINQLEGIFEDVLSSERHNFDTIDTTLGQVVEFLDAERRFKNSMLAQRQAELQ